MITDRLAARRPDRTVDTYGARTERTTTIEIEGELNEVQAVLIDLLDPTTTIKVELIPLPSYYPHGRAWQATVHEAGYAPRSKPSSVMAMEQNYPGCDDTDVLF